MKPLVRLLKLGQMTFQEALEAQKTVHGSVISSLNEKRTTKEANARPNTLILVEHSPVYTIGIRSKQYDKEYEEKLRTFGADFVRTNRGGLITFHGPGQLVAYPILYLGDFDGSRRSIKWYVHQIEATVIEMVTDVLKTSSKPVPLVSTLSEYPGVWIEQERKVAAVGIHASRYVTFHGVAVNCDVNLNWFEHITPCGIEGKEVTSLSKELDRQFTVSEASTYLCAAFENKFNCTLID